MDYGWLVLLLGGDFGVDGLEGALDEAAVGSVEGGVWSGILIFLKNDWLEQSTESSQS